MTPRHLSIGFIFVFLGFTGACSEAAPESRLALWNIVHDQCIPNQSQHSDPAPCVKADLSQGISDGYVIFPDRNGVAQFLLLPTRKVGGIESPELREPHAPNYWNEAWQARTYVFEKLHHTLSWDAIGLAVNSASARSQDQLHIHIDCMKTDVRATLRTHAKDIGTEWHALSEPLAGHIYRVKRLPNLENINLFADLTDRLGIKPETMGDETLIVTGGGPTADNGYILLEDHADLIKEDRAHGEDLLDPSCSLLSEVP